MLLQLQHPAPTAFCIQPRHAADFKRSYPKLQRTPRLLMSAGFYLLVHLFAGVGRIIFALGKCLSCKGAEYNINKASESDKN